MLGHRPPDDPKREAVDDRGEVEHALPGTHLVEIRRLRPRGEEIKLKARTPGWRARRWVLETTHSWLNRNRALLIRRSKKDENHLASGLIALKKARAATPPAAPPGEVLSLDPPFHPAFGLE